MEPEQRKLPRLLCFCTPGPATKQQPEPQKSHRQPNRSIPKPENRRGRSITAAEASQQHQPWRCTRTSGTHFMGCSDTHDRRCAPLSWDTCKRVPPAHCRSDWAWCHLAVAGYDLCYVSVLYISGCGVYRRDLWPALLAVVCLM